MKVIADFTIIPIGVGVSASKYVAECERILAGAGIKTQLHANGTNLEGEWDVVFNAIKECHARIHGMGAPRISSYLHIGTRTDRDQTMEDKIRSVQDKLT